jgi:Pvc16 N-terminal domain
MADYAAIASTCEAIVRLLRSNYRAGQFNAVIDIQVYVAEDFTRPMEQGVSLFLYRVYHDGTRRAPPGRLRDGQRQRPTLPLDLHFFLTAWAKKASLQHEIAGWMMRVMEDNPILSSALLNAHRPNVFHPDESVETSLTQLSVEEVFRIWEVMINHVYELSVPYVARSVEIESPDVLALGELVQQRVVDFRVP